MNTDVELLLREGLDRLTEDAGVPTGLAARILARSRRRRTARYATAVAAAAAVTAVVVAAAAGGLAGPADSARTRPATAPVGPRPALTTAYVVLRVEDALANDDRVMRQTTSVAPSSGGSAFFDGQLTYESVTWAYQGRNSTDLFGARGRLQGIFGTGIVNGKLQGVQVDYIRHEWELIPGMLSGAPVNACTLAGFLEATDSPGTNWPSLIGQTLACGGYKIAGYAETDRTETIKITGSRMLVVPTGPESTDQITVTDTLFISPSTYLPLRITQSAVTRGQRSSPTSADIQWLRPTAANRARASITVPCGYQQISSPSGEPVSGQPSSACG
jgi:hypothetical protein